MSTVALDQKWLTRQSEIAAHAMTIASLQVVATDSARWLIENDESLAPEIAVISDSLNFCVAAAGRIQELVVERIANATKEAMLG